MSWRRPWVVSLALFVGLLGTAHAGRPKVAKAKLILVNDRAEMFGADAVRSADERVRAIHQKFNKSLAIETYKSAPEGRTSNRDITSWAKERYNDLGVKGVYVLICEKPRALRIQVGRATLKRAFTQADAEELSKKIIAELKGGKRDAALAVTTTFVRARLEANLQAAPAK
jgi:hypothetical protein